MLGQQLLEVLLDAVLLQPGVDAELVRGVAEDLLDQDLERVVGLAGDRPEGDTLVGRALTKGAGRRHPVQRLVGAAVGVHEHRAVGLDHQHAGRHREVGGQSSGVVHLAARDHDPHGRGIYPVRQTRPHVGPGGRRRGGRRGPQLRPPAARGRPSGRRAGARPPPGDDLERRGRRLVPLPRPAAGQGHRLGTGDVRRAGAPGCRREDRRGDAPRDGAAGRGDSGPLVDRRRAGAGEGATASAVRRRVVVRGAGGRDAAVSGVAPRAGRGGRRHRDPAGDGTPAGGAAGRELLGAGRTRCWPATRR